MNTPVTCFTALISIAEEEQCEELETYLRNKGSSIVTCNDLELPSRLQAIINECAIVFNQKDISQQGFESLCALFAQDYFVDKWCYAQAIPQELEGFFYSVASLFHVVAVEEVKNVLETFCSKLVEEGTPENAEWRLKLLGLMFCHFTEKDPLRFNTLCHRIKLAGKTGLTSSLVLDIDQLCRWLEAWQVTTDERQNLFELLWEAYKTCDKVKFNVRLLKELVQTYTEENAQRGKEYAEALIVHSVSDPSSFVLDDLLTFPAVKVLEGEKIHELLQLFVFENFLTFEKFYSSNQEFMDGHGFVRSGCATKMRQLTLSSMAGDKDIISLSALREELQLTQDELEEFIIDCIRLKLLEARINQVNQTLVIMTSIHRTFGKSQWQFVHDRLCLWQESILALKANLKTIK